MSCFGFRFVLSIVTTRGSSHTIFAKIFSEDEKLAYNVVCFKQDRMTVLFQAWSPRHQQNLPFFPNKVKSTLRLESWAL